MGLHSGLSSGERWSRNRERTERDSVVLPMSKANGAPSKHGPNSLILGSSWSPRMARSVAR